MSERKIRKEKYIKKLTQYLEEYRNILIIGIDNVGSNQMQNVRLSLRGKGAVLMGKNTLIRKVLREKAPSNPKLECLTSYIHGNMGFVFTNDSLNEIRNIILTHKVPASARVGTFAPNEVVIPSGSTGLDPGQTSFFQTLNISTKIVKGVIEIINPVTLIRVGDKVTASHVSLLDKLNIRPFQYGVAVTDVYEDGTIYSADILDMSQDDLMKKFLAGVNKVAAVSLAIGVPSLASLSHIIGNTFSKLVAISLATEYTFPHAQKFKDILANPDAYVAAAPAASAPAASTATAKAESSESEESGGDMGFSLFD